MDLLKAANVNPSDGDRATRWSQGYNRSARECGVLLELAEACDPTMIALRGTTALRPDTYKVMPFALRGLLQRSVGCTEDDDATWWADAFGGSIEYALTRALVIQPVAGTESWVGDAGVQTVTLGVTPTDAALATAVMAGRAQWFASVTTKTGKPIMHVPPSMAPALVRGGVLFGTPDGEVHAFNGDTVVVGAGYETATPHVFFSSDVVIRMTAVDDEGGPLPRARLNDVVHARNIVAMIDVAPCGIVRVGS